MNRFECMQRLASRLKDELVILSLGASVAIESKYTVLPFAASSFPSLRVCASVNVPFS